ncbi:hypothetical protein [Humibacillus sp. DSM 29435]|uniref:hypothetical protein n=1 Tax=Humibacillus sp. DSM 29435 TaxID=1869167 RepID=UPI000A7E2FED|nr:hypothetical protein [Humibacillus sp. DSM 29435]
MRRVLVALALLAVLFALAVGRGGPSLATGDGIDHGGSGEYGIGMNVATPTQTRNLAESNLCLTGGGTSATVTDVEFVTSSHLSILGFGVRQFPIVAGGLTVDVTRGSLHDADFEHVPVTVACGAADRVTFLAYTVSLDGAVDGSGKGLRVSYLVDGHPGALVLPVSVRLCASARTQSSCAPANL